MKQKIPGLLIVLLISLSAFGQTKTDSLIAQSNDKDDEAYKKILASESLFTFELLPFRSKSSVHGSMRDNSRKIEMVSESKVHPGELMRTSYLEIFGKNILGLYNDVLKEYTKDRILYDDSLSYINAKDDKNLYTIKLKASDDLGDFNRILLKQLNVSFGLKTKEVEQEATYYELTAIEPHEGIITQIDTITKGIEQQSTTHSYKGFKVKQTNSAKEIAHLIEEQLVFVQSEKYYNDPDKNIFFPVITHLEGLYNVNLEIKNDSKDLDAWVKSFDEKGLRLKKKKGKIPYIRIEKDL